MEHLLEIVNRASGDAVQYAAQKGVTLDYTRESAKSVDELLEALHDSLDQFSDEQGKKALWNAAVMFGTYIGKMMLGAGLAEKGFTWVWDEGLPILRLSEGKMEISPITKAHKRILNGGEDSLKSFVDVAFSVIEREFELPKTGVLRVPDVETASGEKTERIVLNEADHYISLVAEGKEDFVIFHSHDGFLQFYGYENQFVCESWFNLGGRRAYALINPGCANTGRVKLATPFGSYTPRERDIISLEQLRTAVREYFSNLEENDFLAKIPHEAMEV